MPAFSREDRELFRAAARAAHDAELAASSSSRSYRNTLLVSTLLLGLAAAFFPLLVIRTDTGVVDLETAASTSQFPTASPIPTPTSAATPTPTTTSTPSPTASPTISPSASTGTSASGGQGSSQGKPVGASELYGVELWGVLGALVGAVAGLRNLRGSTQPIGLQIAQLALKVPTGALTALVGIVLLQAALTPSLQPVSRGKLAAFAILFGAAQEALTSLVDRTAGQLLDKSKTLGDKTATGG